MRCKKNITFSLQNIISFYRNITNPFTGKEKIITLRFRNITLASIIIILSFANITLCSSSIFNNSNVSALDYSSNVGIGFTFNPTLSISLSSNDLVIPNLVPGSMEDSNSIDVSVVTNAAYGYTLSANVGDDIHDNSNLTHTNNTSVFSSIATNADLASLEDSEDSNIWGYSYKNNTVVLPVWSNYNGLSSSGDSILLDNSSAADSIGGIDFKIAAKAGNTQPSGEYTGTINFTAVSKVAPMSLLDSFIASGAEQLNGYFKMQDMTHDICNNVDVEESELQLIDIRDNKVYWVAKLKDDNCWMTQNLDLDLSYEVALTSETSDIDPESYGTTIYTSETGYSKDETTGVVSWLPERSTYVSTSAPGPDNWAGDTGDNSTSGYYHPYSWDRISEGGGLVYPDNIATEAVANTHAVSGNYYNWSAAIASNNSYDALGSQKNSICAKGWRMPANGEYGNLYSIYKTAENHDDAFGLISKPLWLIRAGGVENSNNLHNSGQNGFYWSSTAYNRNQKSYFLDFSHSGVLPSNYRVRSVEISVRCLAR